MNTSQLGGKSTFKPMPGESRELAFLTRDQVARIDELLLSLGAYGEIHLIVQRGELRYINRVESYKAWDDGARK